MIEDVYEPLARYRDEFKDKFARLAREKFQALTEASAVDVAANRRCVARIRELQRQAARAHAMAAVFCGLAFLGLLLALGCWGVPHFLPEEAARLPREGWWLVIAAGAVVVVVSIVLAVKKFGRGAVLGQKAEEQKRLAWAQMQPLNALYTWDITPKLIEATVPRLAFDPYFTVTRLEELHRRYGWSDDFNAGKSIIFAQSGTINGNAFVFGQYREMKWGMETYHGSLEISWTEMARDDDGKLRRVRHTETLTAEVEKPIPTYPEHKVLIYGNEAAPNLTFSREPSGLVVNGGLGDAVKKWWRLRKLKKFSRILDDDSNFTLMTNHEFETWFHAKDRNDEVEFRVLFTPVAQQQELALMQDQSVGYGDDFFFRKQNCINMLCSRHLDEATIDTNPERFHNYSYDDAFANFVAFNERYFKDAYFALAPLLAIPLYQQIRAQEDIWKGILPPRSPSFWEHETIANFHGEDKFQHPDCITHSILKTNVVTRDNGESVVAVTAHGYRGVARTDYVKVHGGDGRWHDVPVHWTEYLPVEHAGNMILAEDTRADDATPNPSEDGDSVVRRSIRSRLQI